jgi:hypothetical protein
VIDWTRNQLSAIFLGIGVYRPVAVLMAVVLVAGAIVSWGPAVGPVARRVGVETVPWRDLARRWALPAGLLAGNLAFCVFTAVGRAGFNLDQARASRYVHLGAALTLPALALAADALARRWRVMTIPLVVLFLVPIPANVRDMEPDAYGRPYMFEREQILSNAIRMPFARDVPRDVRPIPDPYDGDLTIGFLLDAHDEGRFPASDSPVPPALRNELRVRLGLGQRPTGKEAELPECRELGRPLDVRLDRGDRFFLLSRAVVVTVDDAGRPTSRPVTFDNGNGRELTAELDDLHVRIRPAPGRFTYTVCGI